MYCSCILCTEVVRSSSLATRDLAVCGSAKSCSASNLDPKNAAVRGDANVAWCEVTETVVGPLPGGNADIEV